MEITRGEIFLDPYFVYDPQKPEQHCDKYLLILNKDHTHFEDVVYVPATTNKNEWPLKAGCIEDWKLFYFKTDGSFYRAGTVIQLQEIRKHVGEEFEDMVAAKGIQRMHKRIYQEKFRQIINCLKKMREDIPVDIQSLIF